MIQTSITKLLQIEHPILQGGMAWVSDHHIAAAVSAAGGLGIIAGGNAPKEVIRTEIHRLRQKTDRPFGLNIMLLSPDAADLAALAVEECVPVVTTGAGSPAPFLENWKSAGIKVIPVVPSVALAVRMERAGADAVIAEGTEAGGHIGEITTMALVPQIADSVKIPVIAAGGIGDGRGLAAAFLLGAQGVQCGTVFLAAEETNIHTTYKQEVVDARDTGTAVVARIAGHPCRQLKSKFTRRILTEEKGLSGEEGLLKLEAMLEGSLRRAVQDGDIENGAFMAGQIAGMIKEVRPAREILTSMVADACNLMRSLPERSDIILG